MQPAYEMTNQAASSFLYVPKGGRCTLQVTLASDAQPAIG